MKIFINISKPVVLMFLRIFFDRRYLKGRHFEIHNGGYVFSLRSAWIKNILRLSRPLPWPSALTCIVSNPKNIEFHVDDLNNFQSPGTYFQNFNARIVLGKGCYIAPNVGIITSNHDLSDLDKHSIGKDVVIGEKSWIGMNSMILPGVVLGPNTIVAAGSVVTKSFVDGNLTIAGVPAKPIKSNGANHAR